LLELLFDILIRLRNIRSQILKLSESSPIFARFLPSPFFFAFKILYLHCYAFPGGTSRGKVRAVTSITPRVIIAHSLNFKEKITKGNIIQQHNDTQSV